MPKSYNKCQWLVRGSTDLCGKVCLAEYCKIHRALMRKGSFMLPCRFCGVGVTNKLKVCRHNCGYLELHYQARKAFREEFARLASINIFD